MQNLRLPDAASLTPRPSLEPSSPPLYILSAKPTDSSFTLCCVTGHQGGFTPALISPYTITQIKATPALSSFTSTEWEQREKTTRGTDAVVWRTRERERKRYHCSLKASRNVPIQFIQAYTRSGRAQDYCEENLGHIWSQQHSCHHLNGHVKWGLQQGPLLKRGFFFSVLFYNFPSLRCIFRQGCEYIGSSIGVKDLAINPQNDSVSGISVGSFK